jgi:hypothetical protein
MWSSVVKLKLIDASKERAAYIHRFKYGPFIRNVDGLPGYKAQELRKQFSSWKFFFLIKWFWLMSFIPYV